MAPSTATASLATTMRSLTRLPRYTSSPPTPTRILCQSTRPPPRHLCTTTSRFNQSRDQSRDQRPDTNPTSQRQAQDDRSRLNPEPNEYSKSTTDSDAAANDRAAYDTDNPRPQQAKDEAGKSNAVNPLDASPANKEFAAGGVEEGGAKEVQGGLGKK